MALFSERYGYTKPVEVLIREKITEEVENALCTCYDVLEDAIRRGHYLKLCMLRNHNDAR